MVGRAGLALVATMLVAGCGGSASPGSPGPGSTPPVLASLGEPEASPGAGASPSVSVGLTEPPGARLAAGGGGAVNGELGSWTLDGTASDSPWPAASGLERVDLGHGSVVLVGWADATPIESWTVQLATVADSTGVDLREGGGGQANGADFVTLSSLPAGDWVVAVTLRRADGRGEATYYWSISVR